MTKTKKEKLSAEAEEAAAPDGVTGEKSYNELIANMNQIAQPLASKKLSKKLYKCVKKGEARAAAAILACSVVGAWWKPASP